MAGGGQTCLRPEVRGGRGCRGDLPQSIKRTLEKTEALERHVKTVTMRADSLVTTEAHFFQTLIERQEEIIRELNTLHGQLCQPLPTQW